MSLACLDVKRAASKLGLALVVELHPGLVLVKAGALPLEGGVGGGGGADEGGEEVDGAVKGPQDRP